jgi:hypothetical protein
MKPKDKILTYEQAKELRWFTKNCTGLRQEYYALMNQFLSLKDKLDRLENTAILIEKYFEQNDILTGDKIDMDKELRASAEAAND